MQESFGQLIHPPLSVVYPKYNIFSPHYLPLTLSLTFYFPPLVYLLPSLLVFASLPCLPPNLSLFFLPLSTSYGPLPLSTSLLSLPHILSLTLYFPPLSTSPPYSSHPMEFHKLSCFHFIIPNYILIHLYMSYFSFFHVLCQQGRARGRKMERGLR